MKAIIDAAALAAAVAHVVRILGRGETTIGLEVDGALLRVIAYNGMEYSEGRVEARVLTAGDVRVNGPWFLSLARAIPSGEITVSSSEEGVELRGGDAALRMRRVSDDLTPDVFDIPPAAVEVDGDGFARLVASTAYVTAFGFMRSNPILSTVRLTGLDGRLTAFATNRNVAARRVMDAPGVPDGVWLVSGEWLRQNMKGAVSLGFSERVVRVDSQSYTDAAVVADGEYPRRADSLFWDERGVDASATASVDRRLLAEAARMLKSINFDTSAKVVPVRVEDADGMLRVSFAGTAESDDSSGVRMLEAVFDGEGLSFRVDVDYLSGMLNALDGDEVRLLLSPDGRSVILRGDGEDCVQLAACVR